MVKKEQEVIEILPTDSDEELLVKIPQLHDIYLNARQDFMFEWLMEAANVRGIQYSVLDTDRNILVTQRLPEGRKRSKINKIGSWQKRMIARVVTVRPEFEVSPRNLSMEATNAAIAGTAFLQHNMQTQRWTTKRHMLAKVASTFGNAFIYTRHYTDNTRQEPLPQFEVDGETPAIDPETGKQKVLFTDVEDIDQEVLLPHNVLCDNEPTEIDEKPIIILGFWRPLSYYPRQYGAKGEEVSAEGIGKRGANYDLKLLSKNRKEPKLLSGATEMTVFLKPTKDNPKGLFVIYAGGVILERSDWLYEKMAKPPITHFRWGPPEPGEWLSPSPIKDQIPIQADINEIASIVQENIANMGHKKWMNPLGSNIETINDLSGEIVTYTPGMEPHQSAVTSLPHYEVAQLDVLDRMLEDVQLQHSVSKGANQSSVRSAVGLDALAEQDQSPLGIIDAYFQDAYEELGKVTLQIAAEKLDVPRLIRYIGEGRKRTIDNFTGAMVDGGSDVVVRMVDGFMRNKGASQNLILELGRNGLIADNFGNASPQLVTKYLRWALPDVVNDRADQQRQLQYDENEQLIKGTEVPAYEWEYHWDHLDVIDELLNSMEFKALINDRPEILEIVIKHRDAHKGFIATAMGVQAQAEGNEQNQTREQTGGKPS